MFQVGPRVVESVVEVAMCHHVGRGQPVAVLQVPVSWVLACGVCQEEGLECVSPVT